MCVKCGMAGMNISSKVYNIRLIVRKWGLIGCKKQRGPIPTDGIT